MMNQILIRLRLLNVSSNKIDVLLMNEAYRTICFLLKKREYRIRKAILQKLSKKQIIHPKVAKFLVYVVKNDFFSNAKMAMEILNKPNIASTFPKLVSAADGIYQGKLQKEKNLKAFYKSYSTKIKPKSLAQVEMRQLTAVKNQLKKAIRMW